MVTVAQVADYLEGRAPAHRAATWDNVGLLLGSRSAEVRRILTCLTLTPEVAAEAASAHVDLIVSHHPIFFRAVQSLTDETPQGRAVLTLARAGIAVYSAHTAFDNCRGGINEILAQKLNLDQVVSLRRISGNPRCKVVVFVPEQDRERVSDAMFAAGAGIIGRYVQCSFRLAGTGTFFGTDDANPTVGQKGRREEVSEWRLEAVCPESRVEEVVAALRRAHSYEEPAYDVYPLRPDRDELGEGRMGQLAAAESLADFARRVRSALECGSVQIVGDPAGQVWKVALACGAAGEFLHDAAVAGADVFLTGEMRFHDYLDARARRIALVLPGHYATERPGVAALAEELSRQFPGLEVGASRAEADPVSWL
jgi:dinuclear metal center YbgI/SA1388 family protein